MKKIYSVIIFIYCLGNITVAQTDSITAYKKTSAMIPMRDGVKLFTVIIIPVDAKKPVPVLIQRTPYGADIPIPDDSTFKTEVLGSSNILAKDGYIFVYQDIRGKYK